MRWLPSIKCRQCRQTIESLDTDRAPGKAMGYESCHRFGEALGGRTSGGTQQAPHFLGPQDEQDGVDQGGLAHARPAGYDQRAAGRPA